MDSGDISNCMPSPTSHRFCMRDYVRSARAYNISHSWPFPPKYLEMCISHGIREVLPPFEPHHLARYPSLAKDKDWNSSQEAKDSVSINTKEKAFEPGNSTCTKEPIEDLSLSSDVNEHGKGKFSSDAASKSESTELVNHLKETQGSLICHELTNVCSMFQCSSYMASEDKYVLPERGVLTMPSKRESVPGTDIYLCNNSVSEDQLAPSRISLSSSNVSVLTSKKSLVLAKRSSNKRKRRNRKLKKRLMVDILAQAKPPTLDDLNRINGSHWAVELSLKCIGSGCQESTCLADGMRGGTHSNDKNSIQDGFLERIQQSDETYVVGTEGMYR